MLGLCYPTPTSDIEKYQWEGIARAYNIEYTWPIHLHTDYNKLLTSLRQSATLVCATSTMRHWWLNQAMRQRMIQSSTFHHPTDCIYIIGFNTDPHLECTVLDRAHHILLAELPSPTLLSPPVLASILLDRRFAQFQERI
jgi:hypothetical protein